ncbi:hypothetical protein K470DRAFT_261104 [Piedraia hortae CBS 480.64]|uniref:Uncharacterized protein n=1 Tax=Piedraia hortae CBS 480.64 TaxID=1314780 RepID=A0A6A7BQZ2_9PEZI|nr:hypothetical protein K470DRAFT_261104 [Piedraia hortae CBS 480.64]
MLVGASGLLRLVCRVNDIAELVRLVAPLFIVGPRQVGRSSRCGYPSLVPVHSHNNTPTLSIVPLSGTTQLQDQQSNAWPGSRGGARGRGKGRGGKRPLVEEAQSVPNLKRVRITAERYDQSLIESYVDKDYEDNDHSVDEDLVDDEIRDDLGHIGNANHVDFVEDVEDDDNLTEMRASIAPSVTHPTPLPNGGPSILRAQHQRRVTAPLGLSAPRAPPAGTPVPSMSDDPLGIAGSLSQTARVRPSRPTMITADAALPNVALGVAIKYIGKLVTMNKELHIRLQALEAWVNEMHKTKAAEGGICAAMRQLLFWKHARGALWGDNSAVAAELRSRGVMEKAPTQSVLTEISQIKSDLRQNLRKRLRDKWKVSQCFASRADFLKQWDLNYHLLRLIFKRDLQRHGWEKGNGGRGLPGRQGPSRVNRLINNSWTSRQ